MCLVMSSSEASITQRGVPAVSVQRLFSFLAGSSDYMTENLWLESEDRAGSQMVGLPSDLVGGANDGWSSVDIRCVCVRKHD